MVQQIRVTAMGTRVQIHFGEWHFDQFTIALATSRGVQAVVESFADETPFFGTFALTILETFTGQGLSHPLR